LAQLRAADETGVWPDHTLSRLALALWQRGQIAAAGELMHRDTPAATASPLAGFTRAVVWQLLGDREKAEAQLAHLTAQAPGYLADVGAADVRWARAALVFHLGGAAAETEFCLERARVLVPGSQHICVGVPPGTIDLSPQWKALLPGSPAGASGLKST
jgi:hypothetical protein